MIRLTIHFTNPKFLIPSVQTVLSRSTWMGKFNKHKIPNRWEAYSNVGSVVEGTQFIPFKVPLSFRLEWNLEGLTQAVPSLSYVVDITNTDRYYRADDCRQRGWSHVKIKLQGHGALPNNASVQKFYNAVSEA